MLADSCTTKRWRRRIVSGKKGSSQVCGLAAVHPKDRALAVAALVTLREPVVLQVARKVK